MRVLKALYQGETVWYPKNAEMAWITASKQCRVSTLHQMDDEGLIEFEERGNDLYPDTVAKLTNKGFEALPNIDPHKLDDFARGYVECALWSTNDNSDPQGGEPLNQNYDITDIEQTTLKKMVADCCKFQRNCHNRLKDAYELYKSVDGSPQASAGHDFWLTRNGHGAGFWDRGFPDNVAEFLTEEARYFKPFDLIVENGVISEP